VVCRWCRSAQRQYPWRRLTSDFPPGADVDAKLLKLAKERGMSILTTDFNLNRLAQIQDVQC